MSKNGTQITRITQILNYSTSTNYLRNPRNLHSILINSMHFLFKYHPTLS